MRHGIVAGLLGMILLPHSPSTNRRTRAHADRLAAGLLALLFAAVVLPAAVAGEWPGWRGGAAEGRSVNPHGPLHWSPTGSVVWKTPIPGEGYSSPIVTADAVYVTTARRVATNMGLLAAVRLALWLALLLVALPAIGYLGGRCGAEEPAGTRRAAWIGLAGSGLAVVVLCAWVLYGEALLDFNRAVERPWIAACLCGTLALGLSALGSARGSGATVAGGLGLLAFAVLLGFTIPDRSHTVAANAFSDVSKLIYCVIALPALTGAALLLPGLPRAGSRKTASPEGTAGARRALLAPVARGGVALLAVAALAMLAGLAVGQRHATDSTVSIAAPYVPLLRWWILLIPAGLLLFFLRVRGQAGAGWWTNLGTMISAITLGFVSLLALAEQGIARTPYLAYLLGTPHLTPLLGRTALTLFAAACALALLGGLRSAARGPRTPAIAPPKILRPAAYALTLLYFAYASYVPKAPRLDRSIVAVDRQTGTLRWIRGGLTGTSGILNSYNSPASPTPVTDGERIYAYFGTPGLLAVDTHGRRLWVNDQLPFQSREGVASSPILYRDAVIVLSESDLGGYLAAIHGKTGKLLWRTERGKKWHSFAGNCRTPCVKRIAGREVIVVWGYEDLSGYDPVTGRELWSHPVGDLGPDSNPVASAVSDAQHFYLVGPSKTLCLDIGKLAGAGTPMAWEQWADDGAQCSSPVLKNGLLFAVSDNGTAYCLDARTGKSLWSQDLQEQHYASVTAIGDRIYLLDTKGRTTILACDRTYRVLARNKLGEQTFASPAPVDGALFLRASNHLYCVREPGGQ